MNILFLVETANLGGHTLSAITTANEMKSKGHTVLFGCGPGVIEKDIRDSFVSYRLIYHYFYGKGQTYFSFKSLETESELAKIAQNTRIDHIHAFDARSYIIASIFSIKSNLYN